MPVQVIKQGSKYRLVEIETGHIAANKNNRPIDGGGHEDEAKAARQASYINQAIEKKEKG
jgi:hypothetical protein